MNKKLAIVKNFVAQRKTKILVAALVGTTTAAVLQQIGIRQHNEFLKEHDLFDKFYNPENIDI